VIEIKILLGKVLKLEWLLIRDIIARPFFGYPGICTDLDPHARSTVEV